MGLWNILFGEAKDKTLTKKQRQAAALAAREAGYKKPTVARSKPIGRDNPRSAQTTCGQCGKRFHKSEGFWSNEVDEYFCSKAHRRAYIEQED